MNLRFFKMNNGEEFIAELLTTSEHHVEIKQPVVLSMNNNEANFILWCPLREDRKFLIKQSNIMFDGAISSSVANEYTRLFNPSSIIQPPSQGFGSVRAKSSSSAATSIVQK